MKEDVNEAASSADDVRATADGTEEQQPASDASTPMSKKAKLAPAAAAASSFPAGGASGATAAGASVSMPLPCARLDQDSLSVVFSFLNATDFLHAVRVSHHWRTARVKKSAWPAFNLETMIAHLRDDDFDNPQRRKLDVTTSSGDAKKLGALLKRPGVMDLSRHVTEIKLTQTSDPLAVASEMRASAAMMHLILVWSRSHSTDSLCLPTTTLRRVICSTLCRPVC